MRKAICTIVVITALAGLLTACSFSRPSRTTRVGGQPRFQNTQAILPTATLTAYLTHTPTEETPTPVATATPKDYAGQVAGIIAEYKVAYYTFDLVHTQWTDDYSLLTDSAWRAKMQSSLADLQTISDKMQVMASPSDRYSYLTESIKALGTDIALIVTNYTKAINKNDPEPIKQVTVSMEDVLLDTKTISVVLEGLGFVAPTAVHSSGSATARCVDGTYSYSSNRRGSCSGHGGVARWLVP